MCWLGGHGVLGDGVGADEDGGGMRRKGGQAEVEACGRGQLAVRVRGHPVGNEEPFGAVLDEGVPAGRFLWRGVVQPWAKALGEATRPGGQDAARLVGAEGIGEGLAPRTTSPGRVWTGHSD